MTTEESWQGFYERVKNDPPRKLLLTALNYVENFNLAIDLGCGISNDMPLLLKKFKQVEACDTSPLVKKHFDKLNAKNLTFKQASFLTTLKSIKNADLISAQMALPFTDKSEIEAVFKKLPSTLATNGIFCGQLFGEREMLVTARNCDHTLAEVKALSNNLDIILLEEIERNAETKVGPKHRHSFSIILKNKSS